MRIWIAREASGEEVAHSRKPTLIQGAWRSSGPRILLATLKPFLPIDSSNKSVPWDKSLRTVIVQVSEQENLRCWVAMDEGGEWYYYSDAPYMVPDLRYWKSFIGTWASLEWARVHVPNFEFEPPDNVTWSESLKEILL